MSFQKFIKDYFTFNKKERRGLIVLCGGLALLLIFKSFSSQLFHLEEKQDFSDFIKQLEEKQNQIDKEELTASEPSVHEISYNPGSEVSLFHFNPNGLPVKEWCKLGLSEKQAKSIKKYEAAGGTFRSKDDLKKMYAVSEALFQKWLPYIDLPDKIVSKGSEKKIYEKKSLLVVELNSADTSELIKLPFIGPSIARRIVKYRERLGGFYSLEQLKEVYGMDTIHFTQLTNRLRLDVSEIKKINLNSIAIDDLKKHPYLKYHIAKSIIMIRDRHGRYSSIEGIKKSDLVTEDLYLKLAPYLSLN